MLQILELNHTHLDLSGWLARFQEVTSLSFPALDGFPTTDSLPIPKLDGLLTAVQQFDFSVFQMLQGQMGYTSRVDKLKKERECQI
jgi:hypothetical protein